jgi:hypothetical protein
MRRTPLGPSLLLALTLPLVPAPVHAQATGQAAPRPARPAAARQARVTLDVEITDRAGKPIEGVQVTAVGPVERDTTSDANGRVSLTGLGPGTYRLRFSKGAFVTLERDVVIAAGVRPPEVVVALTAAPTAPPPPPAPAATAPIPTPAASSTARPIGDVRTVRVPDFLESNFIGRSEPQKLSVVGCTGYATTRILQVREPLDDRSNAEADEMLYVVAGEATVEVGGKELSLDAGALVTIPRGTSSSIARRGRNPVMLISVLSGPPCMG